MRERGRVRGSGDLRWGVCAVGGRVAAGEGAAADAGGVVVTAFAHSQQLDWLNPLPFHPKGRTYEPEHDKARLEPALVRVLRLLSDGKAHTTREIRKIGGSAGDSRLRELRNRYQLPIPSSTRVRGRENTGDWEQHLDLSRLGEKPLNDPTRPTHAETIAMILKPKEVFGHDG
jgi:hypothetical protein